MLIGRKKEIHLLEEVLASPKAEMIAVIGRRRVGKTFLIDTIYKDSIIFKQTGVRNASNQDQLRTFTNALRELTDDAIETPTDWLDAFFLLKKYLKPHISKDKKVVLFFDELSWLAVPNSNFPSSWIIKKVINDKGGLHNRITRYLHLKPFTLRETEEYLQSKHINFNRYQIVQLYMAFGGIPLYLEAVQKGKSAIQNINDICFSETGLLQKEFHRLYAALFDNADRHIAIIRALATKQKGLSRSEIIKLAKVPNGSSTTTVLEELEQSDFIMAYPPYKKKKKGKIYRLIDEYSLFYLRFIEHTAYAGEGTFLQLSEQQTFKTWSGYAYEGICMKHIPQIKKALGIGGVYTTTHSFSKPATATEEGLQIDMLIERADRVINLFEIKFYNADFVLTKAYADQLRKRLWAFQRRSKTRHQVWLTMITTFGIRPNKHSLGLIEKELTLEDLFS